MAFINATMTSGSTKSVFINVDQIVAAFPTEGSEGTSIQVCGQGGPGSLYIHFVEESFEVIRNRINNAISSGL